MQPSVARLYPPAGLQPVTTHSLPNDFLEAR
jgi:hypothetical protein